MVCHLSIHLLQQNEFTVIAIIAEDTLLDIGILHFLHYNFDCGIDSEMFGIMLQYQTIRKMASLVRALEHERVSKSYLDSPLGVRLFRIGHKPSIMK